jgi:hypothetical protein
MAGLVLNPPWRIAEPSTNVPADLSEQSVSSENAAELLPKPLDSQSELVPSTGIDNPVIQARPGHDFGAISSISSQKVAVAQHRPGHDFGAISSVSSQQVPLVQHRSGHDFGAISNVSQLNTASSIAHNFPYKINGNTVVRRSELGPLTGTD